jgi:hypothetical protein
MAPGAALRLRSDTTQVRDTSENLVEEVMSQGACDEPRIKVPRMSDEAPTGLEQPLQRLASNRLWLATGRPSRRCIAPRLYAMTPKSGRTSCPGTDDRRGAEAWRYTVAVGAANLVALG